MSEPGFVTALPGEWMPNTTPRGCLPHQERCPRCRTSYYVKDRVCRKCADTSSYVPYSDWVIPKASSMTFRMGKALKVANG